MSGGLLFLALIAAGLIGWGIYRYRKAARRRRLLNTPLTAEQTAYLEKNFPIYRRIPEPHKTRLQGCINVFLDEKVFVGRQAVTITDPIRWLIAANACVLIMNRDTPYFFGFETIILYPDAYIAKVTRYDGMVAVQENSARAGESWVRGPIVLSLSDVEHGSKNSADGHNVVMHEFAHKLDEENGVVDGLPVLRESAHYREWAEVLNKEYDQFLKRVERGKNRVIDEYGAVSAPEFFAVATESFFEKSAQMKKRLPELYQQLEQYYGLDPAGW